MEFSCYCCSKIIKVKKAYQIKTCHECGRVVCVSCRLKNGCVECVTNPEDIKYEYFKEKYEGEA